MRRRPAREPASLVQIPVWGAAEPPLRPRRRPDGLDELLAGLNPEQRKAVTHRDGPLLVVAGAGTGKTQVITRRIAWLIATRRARPAEILALTFTDQAADEMQARVDQLVPYGYTDTAISTFHAFGDRLVREFALELGLPSDVRVLSRPETVVFLREHVFELGPRGVPAARRPHPVPRRARDAVLAGEGRGRVARRVPRARRAARRAGGRGAGRGRGGRTVATEADRDAAAALDEEARRQAELARAYATYQRLLAENGAIDFGDQVSLALRLLRESPAARQSVQARFRYVLVDEFQDTNRAQSELVGARRRDASQRHGRGRRRPVDLQVPRRGDQQHPRVPGAVPRGERRRPAPQLPVARPDPRRARTGSSGTTTRTGSRSRAGIVKKLVPERGERRRAGRPPRGVRDGRRGGGLDRGGGRAPRRARAPRPATSRSSSGRTPPRTRSCGRSTSRAIPWRFSGHVRPLRPARGPAAAVVPARDRGPRPRRWTSTRSRPRTCTGSAARTWSTIVTKARRRNRTVFEVLEELGPPAGDPAPAPGDPRRGGDGSSRTSRRYVALAHERPAGEVLYAFLRGSGWLKRLAETDSVADEEALSNIARFFDIIRAQSALLADDRAVFVARHLQTLIQAGDDPPTADIDPDADAVAVMTVHKAKGLEFPVVYLPGLITGRFPAIGRREQLALPLELVNETLPEGDYQLQEERRLFYVGMTRARDELVLSHAADYGGQRARRVSPFVLEALDLPVAAGHGGGRARRRRRRVERLAGLERTEPAPAPRRRARRRAAVAVVLRDRRLPDLPAQVQVRPRAADAARAAPLDDLRRRRSTRRSSEFHKRHARGDVMSEDAAVRVVPGGLDERRVPVARARGGAARRRPPGARPVPRGAARPGAVMPAWVEREFSFLLDGDRVRGRFDRVDIIAARPATSRSR